MKIRANLVNILKFKNIKKRILKRFDSELIYVQDR